MRICYSFASKSRPIKFFKALNNIREMSDFDNYFFIAKLDEDDETMNTDPIKEKLEQDYPEVIVKWGISSGKVHAINRSLEDMPECDIIIMMSDDIILDVKGFDTEIRNAFSEHFPNFDGAVHFPDDHGKQKTIIVSILGVNLYKQLGYLYHPDFLSVYADDHFTGLTRKMGKYHFINKRLFTHAHPHWNLSEWDSQYRATESKENYKKDRETFLRLQANNYGL